jgi:hypothetical protein
MQIIISFAFRDTVSSSFEVSSIAQYSSQERKFRCCRVERGDLRTGHIGVYLDITSSGM